MVSVGRHKNITLLSYSEVESLSGYVGNYKIRVKRKPRYVDETICTGCGKCAEVCPVEVDNTFDIGLSNRKATYRTSAQAIPNSFTIDKKGIAPCRTACPTDQRAQGYIALIRQKRYADAYWAIRREHPFPSVCGRVCNHRCEDVCNRGKYDQPVNIMGLKRFVSDWAYTHRSELKNMRNKSIFGTPFVENPIPTGKNIAIIGAGPAGLTAALDLIRIGHTVKVFDQLPVAGGMMRVGIPPHRLPIELLDWEIQQIVGEGVEIVLNTRINDIPGLLENGYDAVMIATGAHIAKKIPIRNSNHPDNLLSLDVLRKACLGEDINIRGKKILVLGGGNVALDTARTANRLCPSEVSIACLEPRGEMPGFDWEIKVAEEEGIHIFPGRNFKEIVVTNNKIIGVRCEQIKFLGFLRGKPNFTTIPNTEHILPADIVIWAIGQGPDFSFLPQDGSINTKYPIGIQSDHQMMTTHKGVFVAGDVHRGVTFFVVDAIGEGHKVARSIDRYLRGEKGMQEPHLHETIMMDLEEIKLKINNGKSSNKPRVAISSIPLEARRNNFSEVDLALSEDEALSEAQRCLSCGICSECLECVAACDRGAINHDMREEHIDINVGTIILATGFKDFDPSIVPELGYGKLDNVITAMEFERLINTSGPTLGKVLLKNGKPPNSVAIIHCVGSRDINYNQYCSRACCMYSLKFAQLVKEYVKADVYEIYRDMRTFGKDYEEFFNRTKKLGANFYHGEVTEINCNNGKLRVKWKNGHYQQPDQINVDMVILSTGLEAHDDNGKVANLFGISRSKDGFFLERHPKLAPVETVSDGIYLAGTCQAPKDIPDTVAQAGAAAAAALSLIDQKEISLEPTIAEVDSLICAGCGQCIQSCPYEAITLKEIKAYVNEFICKGCGTCASTCPNKAISIHHYNDRQLINEMIGALSENEPVVPGIIQNQEAV